jgi:tetratricopeptide (TPR) repeat protein
MGLAAGAGDGVLLELRAREAFLKRDYRTAGQLAKVCAEQAAADGDQGSWWHMTFLEAECYRDMGQQQDCIAVTKQLRAHALTVDSSELMCRVLTLESVSLQGLGELEAALADAEEAVQIGSTASLRAEIRIDAQTALVATLAERGDNDEAWQQCKALIELLEASTDAQAAGKGYWAVGNVAFLRQESGDGVHYHQLAAERLSPSNDLALWAWFNRASAAMRLSAGIADADTEDCMDRAELAASIIGVTDDIRRSNHMNRAHWHFRRGEFAEAVRLLLPICAEAPSMAHQRAGEAHLLLSQALREVGECAEALRYLKGSQAYFDQAGAMDRSAHVADEIAGFPQAS